NSICPAVGFSGSAANAGIALQAAHSATNHRMYEPRDWCREGVGRVQTFYDARARRSNRNWLGDSPLIPRLGQETQECQECYLANWHSCLRWNQGTQDPQGPLFCFVFVGVPPSGGLSFGRLMKFDK